MIGNPVGRHELVGKLAAAIRRAVVRAHAADASFADGAPPPSDPPLLVAACDVGQGVFANRPFRGGERILVFTGEAYDRDDPIHGTPEGANLLQIGPRRYVLPRPVGLYVNHSCNPNAGLSGTDTLIALRNIPRGAEIRFDYSTGMDEDLWTMPCACKERTCRRVVRDFRCLPPETQRRYLALGIVPEFIAARYRGNGRG